VLLLQSGRVEKTRVFLYAKHAKKREKKTKRETYEYMLGLAKRERAER